MRNCEDVEMSAGDESEHTASSQEKRALRRHRDFSTFFTADSAGGDLEFFGPPSCTPRDANDDGYLARRI